MNKVYFSDNLLQRIAKLLTSKGIISGTRLNPKLIFDTIVIDTRGKVLYLKDGEEIAYQTLSSQLNHGDTLSIQVNGTLPIELNIP